MVQQGAVVYEEGTHLQKFYYSFTYSIALACSRLVQQVDPDNEALQFMCSFAAEHLHDDGCIVLFHSYSRKSKENIAGVCEAYNLV